jgi:hypothetical protein
LGAGQGSSLLQAGPKFGEELAIYGLIALSQGALLVSMLWAAAIACMLDRRFLHAAGWLVAGAALSSFGIIHAYDLSSAGIMNKLGIFVAPEFAVSYTTAALFLVGCHSTIDVFLRRGRTLKRSDVWWVPTQAVRWLEGNLKSKVKRAADRSVQPHTFFERYCVPSGGG